MLKKKMAFALSAMMTGAAWAGPAAAKGDLAVMAEELEPLVLGSSKSDYDLSVKEYRLETGKSYMLTIRCAGYKEYELEAEEFFRNIWLRTIEAGEVRMKVARLDSLEFELAEGEVEITFVPIRTGTYEFSVEGLEQKGMVGTFIVE